VATEGRTIFYKPAVKQERLQKPLLKSLVRRLFAGICGRCSPNCCATSG